MAWRSDLSRRFHFVKPAEDPVTKVPTNFQVSLLYILVNLECYVKYSTCSSGHGRETVSNLEGKQKEKLEEVFLSPHHKQLILRITLLSIH